MSGCDPRIVWPAPGLPALAEAGQQTLDVVLACEKRCHEQLRSWTRELVLRDPVDGSVVPLDVCEVRAIERPELDPRIAGFAGLPGSRKLEFTACTLCWVWAPSLLPPATSRVFDLVRRGRCERPRCVAFLGQPSRALRLAFASDIHCSATWRPIIEAVDRHAPDLSPRVLDPTWMWEQFVDHANRLWLDGSLDLVILGGDLVDHVLTRFDDAQAADGGDETNVHRFLDSLSRLRPPVFVIPGNHDYRLFPWRPQLYGLHGIGLRAAESRRVLQSAGMWGKVPLGVRDLRSLWTRDAQGCTALAQHLSLLAPVTDFTVTCGGTRLVFVSTGADAVARVRHVGVSRLMPFLRSLPSVWHSPDAEGLYEEQVNGITSALDGTCGGAVFMHSPLLHPRDDCFPDEPLGGADSAEAEDGAAERAVERRWHRAGLRSGVCFRNAARLLKRLAAARCPVVTFSGHVHRTGCIEVDRQSRRFRSAPLAAPANPDEKVVMITAPALGQRHPDQQEPPGFLLAEFNEGRLVNISQQDLAEYVSPSFLKFPTIRDTVRRCA